MRGRDKNLKAWYVLKIQYYCDKIVWLSKKLECAFKYEYFDNNINMLKKSISYLFEIAFLNT